MTKTPVMATISKKDDKYIGRYAIICLQTNKKGIEREER